MKERILREMHDSPLGGHSGSQHTYKRVKQVFYWPKVKEDVRNYIAECEICLKNKSDSSMYAGLLQPLPINSNTDVE